MELFLVKIITISMMVFSFYIYRHLFPIGKNSGACKKTRFSDSNGAQPRRSFTNKSPTSPLCHNSSLYTLLPYPSVKIIIHTAPIPIPSLKIPYKTTLFSAQIQVYGLCPFTRPVRSHLCEFYRWFNGGSYHVGYPTSKHSCG